MAKKDTDNDSMYDVKSLLVAQKFGKHRNTIAMAKKRYKEGKKSMWELYCKAYQWELLCEKATETNKNSEEHF